MPARGRAKAHPTAPVAAKSKAREKAKAKAAPRKRSGRYVSDKSLELKRVPHAFAFFLSDMKRKGDSQAGGMAEMSKRYKALSVSERQVYVDKSQQALSAKREARVQMLNPKQDTGTQVIAATEISVGSRADIHGGGVHTWLSLPLPAASPDLPCVQNENEELVDRPPIEVLALPSLWRWVEAPSAVQHDLQRVGPRLGAGTFGNCSVVQDMATGEVFCIKSPHKNTDKEHSHLLQEHDTLQKLRHPNVVHPIALVTSHDAAWKAFLMPLAAHDMWQWLNLRNITRGDEVSALVQVARGLSYVHYAGVVHMDMKPDNILVYMTVNGGLSLQISDFGSAMAGPTDNRTGQRIECAAINTALYRPLDLFHNPFRTVYVHYRCDLWAFGCIVFDGVQHPRLRSTDGRAARLFTGVNMMSDIRDTLRVRNHRLVRHLDAAAVAVVTRFQPDRPAQHRMRAEHVRAVAALRVS